MGFKNSERDKKEINFNTIKNIKDLALIRVLSTMTFNWWFISTSGRSFTHIDFICKAFTLRNILFNKHVFFFFNLSYFELKLTYLSILKYLASRNCIQIAVK